MYALREHEGVASAATQVRDERIAAKTAETMQRARDGRKGRAREVSTVEAAPYYPTEVHYHAEVEPTFERFVYRPLTQAVLGAAGRLRVIQAGSLHAYLAYVMALILSLIILLWWRG